MQRESGHSILITVEEMDMVKASRRLAKRKISIKVERKCAVKKCIRKPTITPVRRRLRYGGRSSQSSQPISL